MQRAQSNRRCEVTIVGQVGRCISNVACLNITRQQTGEAATGQV